MATKKRVGNARGAQDALRTANTIAALAAGAVVSLQQLWKVLDRDHQLTDSLKRLLQALIDGSKPKDPVVRLRRTLESISDHVNEKETRLTPEQVRLLREQVRQCSGLLDVADHLVGADRRKVLKDVKKRVSAMVREILDSAMSDHPQDLGSPSGAE